MNEQSIKKRGKVLAGLVACALAFAFATSAAGAKPPAGTAAAAKPDLGAAKKHYADGEKKYKAGDFAGALADFQAANDIRETPQAERYIGMCEDSLGHLQEAAGWFDKFLAHVPEKMATQGEEVRKRVAEIKATPGKVHIESTPAGASVTIDGKPEPAPAPTDVELTPGAHTIRLTAEGRLPTERQIDVAFASTQTLTADLEVEPPPPPPPAPPPVAAMPPPPPPPPPAPPRSKVPAFVTGGLAIAAAGVGTAFGVIALNDKSDFDKNPTTQTADNGDAHALISDMAFGVALTFAVTSAVLFFTKDESPSPPAATAKAAAAKEPAWVPKPWVGPRAGGAGVALQF